MKALQLPIQHVNGFELPTLPQGLLGDRYTEIGIATPQSLVIRSVVSDVETGTLEHLEELGIGHLDRAISFHSLRFVLGRTTHIDDEGQTIVDNPKLTATIERGSPNYLSRINFSGLGYCFRKLRSDERNGITRPISSELMVKGSIRPYEGGSVGQMTVTPKQNKD